MVEYLRKYGPSVLANGYELVAIRPGTKRPFGDDWQDKVIGPKAIERLGSYGLGVKARLSPGVDIDVRDPDLVDHLKAFTFELCGVTLERVGLPPKTLLPYRSDEPFRKVNSKTFLDDAGNRNKLEVLGLGQQYVVFAVHPDTKKPYRWDEQRAFHDTPRSSLPEITRSQAEAIAAEFERCAEERGWKLAPSSTSNLPATRGNVDLEDAFASDKQKIDISNDELVNSLMRVPGNEDYDRWRDVGMALYHQFDGEEEGLILWHQWSSQASNYDSDVLDEKWATFDVEGKKREPITARVIVKWAKAEDKRLATETYAEYRDKLRQAPTFDALTEVCDEIKKITFSQALRESLASDVKMKLKNFGNDSPTIGLARSMIRFENREMTVAPPWMKPFVYISSEDRFFSTRTCGEPISLRAFDASYDRYMLTIGERLEGKSTPEHHASYVALNRVQVPVVERRIYFPGAEDTFTLNGDRCVNTYSAESVPEVPEKLSPVEREIVARMERHLAHLFEVERDRKLLLSFCAYVVQNPGKRCNWAPLLQGVEGDGKTTIGEWVAAALGGANAKIILGSSLEEKFTGWAEGSQFVTVEEVRLAGDNRYDVVNRMKVYITNEVVPIRRMQRDAYNVPNMTSYILTSQYKDAVPAGQNDNRYFPMFSRWQRREALDAFLVENPEYYVELRSVLNHPGAIRKFFLDYEMHPDFYPDRRAPKSSYRREMTELDRDEEDDALGDLLAEGRRDCCDTLLDSAVMSEEIVAHGGSAPQGKAMNRFLTKAGFTWLGRIKIKGEMRRLWSRTPSMFYDAAGATDNDRVRAYYEDDDPL